MLAAEFTSLGNRNEKTQNKKWKFISCTYCFPSRESGVCTCCLCFIKHTLKLMCLSILCLTHLCDSDIDLFLKTKCFSRWALPTSFSYLNRMLRRIPYNTRGIFVWDWMAIYKSRYSLKVILASYYVFMRYISLNIINNLMYVDIGSFN